MNKHIKIYKRDKKYCFTINKFSSVHHSSFTKFSKSEYNYAWEAYNDAKNIKEKYSYHIDALERFAFEDLSKPVIEDVAAERKLADHYEIIYDGLADTANGMNENDKNRKKVNYFEAKAVVQEILFVIKSSDEDELADEDELINSKKRLNSIISKIKKLVHKYYKEDLKRDQEKSEEEPEMPMDLMGDPMGDPMGMPMASSNSLIKTAQSLELYKEPSKHIDHEIIKELFNDYGKRACSAIEMRCPNVVWENCSNGVNLLDGDDVIIFLGIGDDLFIKDVMPGSKISNMYPYQSLEFYQSYWKPIIESIGHCCVGDGSHILYLDDKCLPDIPNEFPYSSNEFNTINKKSKSPTSFTVSFKGKNPSWFIDPVQLSVVASAKYSKEDYYKNGKGAIVVCIDPTLNSYYKNTGHVIQVIPFGEHLEVDINFGNHICRMTEDQFDIIDSV